MLVKYDYLIEAPGLKMLHNLALYKISYKIIPYLRYMTNSELVIISATEEVYMYIISHLDPQTSIT
jgi:hypothetical protein